MWGGQSCRRARFRAGSHTDKHLRRKALPLRYDILRKPARRPACSQDWLPYFNGDVRIEVMLVPMISPETTSSTLRFIWRPAAVELSATGIVFPKPREF